MKSFKPIDILSCSNILDELDKIGSLYALDIDQLDFDITQINTLKKDSKSNDFYLLNDYETQELFKDDEHYLRRNFELEQNFNLTIHDIETDSIANLIDIQISQNAYTLDLILKKGLEIKKDMTFYQNLHKEIIKKKALNNVIIEIKESYEEDYIDISKKIEKLDGVLEEDVLIVYQKARGFVPDIKMEYIDKLMEHWKDKHDNVIEKAYYGVKPDDVVGVLHKPKSGSNGRDIYGKYIQVVEMVAKKSRQDLEAKLEEFQKKFAKHTNPNVKKEEAKKEETKKEEENAQALLEIKFKEGEFKRVEKEDVIEFVALALGYARYYENELQLITNLSFTNMNSREHMPLLDGIGKNLIVEVKSSNAQNDAVGSGLIIEADEIRVDGSIGEKASLTCNKLEILGHTHQSSTIKAQLARIDIHKGELEADHAIIKNLELGVIKAETIEVQEVSGGTLSASEITIAKLHSHSKIQISKSLAILGIDGGENKIIITYIANYKTKEKVASIKQRMDRISSVIKKKFIILQKDIYRIKKVGPLVEKFKTIMKENKQKGIKNDEYILSNMAQYILILRRAERLKNKITLLQNDLKVLRDELKEIEHVTKSATITCEESWKKENQIIYEYLYPKPGSDTMLLSDGEMTNISVHGNKLIKDTLDLEDFE